MTLKNGEEKGRQIYNLIFRIL